MRYWITAHLIEIEVFYFRISNSFIQFFLLGFGVGCHSHHGEAARWRQELHELYYYCIIYNHIFIFRMTDIVFVFPHRWIVEWIPRSCVGAMAGRRRVFDEFKNRVSELLTPCFSIFFSYSCFRREIDALQSAVSSWYARFKADTKQRLQRQLQEVFSRPRSIKGTDSNYGKNSAPDPVVASPSNRLEGTAS